ncbi:unnamed protein product [Cochlearia groenlandica]
MAGKVNFCFPAKGSSGVGPSGAPTESATPPFAQESATPPFAQVQSVVNHMWGKGKHIKIHINTFARSMLVRIPNDFMRTKVLERKWWYIEVDLNKPLFYEVELTRQNGEKIDLSVSYPWTLPSCSNCQKLGHNLRNFPYPSNKHDPPEAPFISDSRP